MTCVCRTTSLLSKILSMKIRFTGVVSLLAIVFLLSQCSSGVFVQGNVPPGQAKKAAGTQSAKPFAGGELFSRLLTCSFFLLARGKWLSGLCSSSFLCLPWRHVTLYKYT